MFNAFLVLLLSFVGFALAVFIFGSICYFVADRSGRNFSEFWRDF